MVGILSLPAEILLEICKCSVRLDDPEIQMNWELEYATWDNMISWRHDQLQGSKSLQELSETCRGLRAVANAVLHEVLAVGLGKDKHKVSLPRLVRLLELYKRFPEKRDYVKRITIGPWLPRSVWKESSFKDKHDEVVRLKTVMKSLAKELGLGNESFIDALEEGRHDVIIALLLHCLPRLKYVEILVMCTCGSGRSPRLSSWWIEESLRLAQPACAVTIEKFKYKINSHCKLPWSGLVWEMMKMPNLETLKCEEYMAKKPNGVSMPGEDAEVDHQVGDEEGKRNDIVVGEKAITAEEGSTVDDGENESDVWEEDYDSEWEEDDEWEASDGEEIWEMDESHRLLTETCADPQSLHLIPEPKSCNFTNFKIAGFGNSVLALEKLLAAPKALKSATFYLSKVKHSELSHVGHGLLSQADTLTKLKADFGNLYYREIITQLKCLTRLTIRNPIFLVGAQAYSPQKLAARSHLIGFDWLPPSIVDITIEDYQLPPLWCQYIATSKLFRQISREQLPNLARVTMLVPMAMLRFPGFRATQEIMRANGLEFRYSIAFANSKAGNDLFTNLEKAAEIADKISGSKARQKVMAAADDDVDIPLKEGDNRMDIIPPEYDESDSEDISSSDDWD